MSYIPITGDTAPHEKRALGEAMKRGSRGRCPNCGEGRLFKSFAKPVDSCEVCGEEIHHHRADDLPPYLNIFIVGHLVVGGFTMVEVMTDWPTWVHLAIWTPVLIGMALALMQPLKGAVIGLQWANYMHGFGGEEEEYPDPELQQTPSGDG